MPRIRKTSTQPKRKVKKIAPKPRPVYPEYIENFIKEVESKTPYSVIADQYSKDSSYNVGVLKKEGRVNRCIWMVQYATGPEHLSVFWNSLAMKPKA
jgi:hypothetical protein